KRDDEYVGIYRELLHKSVMDRLPHGPAAIFLSSGMDSSTIAATICERRGHAVKQKRLHAVCADLKPLFDDEEGAWASRVAGHLSIEFELSHHGDCTPFSGFERLSTHFPEPVSNPFRAVYDHLYRQIAPTARVSMKGYGGDDVLTGQTGAYLAYLVRHGQFGRAASDITRFLITKHRLPPLRAGIYSWLRRLGARRLQPQYPQWIAPSFEKEFSLRERWFELQRKQPAIHPSHAIGYDALTCGYWSQIMDQEDAACTGIPLEIRLPLFDYRLSRFLL